MKDYDTERRWTVNCTECDHREILDTTRADARKHREWHDHAEVEIIPWNKIVQGGGS